jgi:flagellin-like hook-associated protein FlgL
MLPRISTIGSDLFNLNQVMQVKQGLDTLSEQVTSGEKSQDYAGLASVASQVINYENEDASTNNYLTNNTIVNTQMSAMASAYSSMKTTMNQFQQKVESFISSGYTDAQDIQNLQDFAFQSLQNMQYYLNTQVGGQYLFSGSKTDTPPVNLDYATLSDFQAKYDGHTVAYPTTRAADLSQVTTTVQDTGSLTFNDADGTITAANVGQFANIPVGSNVTIAGSANNSGTYTVLANDGTNITVSHNLTNLVSATKDTGASLVFPLGAAAPGATTIQDATGAGLTFNGSTISDPGNSASWAANMADLKPGASFIISGAANPADDGTFTVVTNNGTSLTVSPSPTNATNDTSATLSFGLIQDSTAGQGLSFDGNTISDPSNSASWAANMGSLTAGTSFTVAGASNPANDGTYTVVANDGTSLTVSKNIPGLQDESADITAAITGTNVSGTITDPTGTGLTFSGGQISDASGLQTAALAEIPVNSVITIQSATNPANDGNWVVTANNNGVLSVAANVVITKSDQTKVNTGVTFTYPDTMTATTSGAFGGLTAGSAFTVSNALNPANDGTYVVASVDSTGTTLTIQRPDLSGPLQFTNGTDATASLISGKINYAPASVNPPPTGGLTFNTTASGVSTITSVSAGPPPPLANVPVGQVIAVNGATNAAYDGSYVVTGVDTTTGTLTVRSVNQTSLIDEAANASATINNATAAPITPGSLAFYAGSSVIIAGTAAAGDLTGVQKGQTVTVAGSNSNNGSFQVTNTFSTAVVSEAAPSTATITYGTTTLANGSTNGLTFTAGNPPTVSAGTAGSLAGITAGTVIHVAGTQSNNGDFVVEAIDGTNTTLTLAPANSAIQVAKNVSLSTSSYYQGDSTIQSQQIDTNLNMAYGVTAMDPAFDKAIRAMALIAEGQVGTAGGLGMNMDRLTQANYLVTSAIDNTASGAPPFGAEQSGNLNELSETLSLQQTTLSNTTTGQNSYVNFVDSNRDSLTKADQTETITELLNQQESLQASYQTMATVRSLSLLNYMK